MSQLSGAGLPTVLGLTGQRTVTGGRPAARMTGTGRIPRVSWKQLGQDGRGRQRRADNKRFRVSMRLRLLLLDVLQTHQTAHDIRIDVMCATATARDLIRLWRFWSTTNICSTSKKTNEFNKKFLEIYDRSTLLLEETNLDLLDEGPLMEEPTSPKPSETKSPDGTMVELLTGESTGMDTCRGVGL